jgi:beta-lactamase family protein
MDYSDTSVLKGMALNCQGLKSYSRAKGMQERKEARYSGGMQQQSFFVSRITIILLLGGFYGALISYCGFAISRQQHGLPATPTASKVTVMNGAVLAIGSQRSLWAQGETALLDAPGTGKVIAHIGQHFSLTLLGDAIWKSGMLWYHVEWATPKDIGNGWVEASAITFDSPGNVPGWASFDVLSPPLASYLASIGDNVDAFVFDVTRQRYYTYHANAQFITGSSMKVPIMLTFLDMTERQGRQPDANEMNLLTTMIENSNNDSASALYYGKIGGAAGVASYLQKIGITGLNPGPNAWGWSLITPQTMVNLLTDLYQGKILTAGDRNLAFYLMEHIESDQRVGVGDTAPSEAIVAMKDGWLPGPDSLWAMNSSGIVTVSLETYIIAVYTKGQGTLEDGQRIARHVCGTVASLLT